MTVSQRPDVPSFAKDNRLSTLGARDLPSGGRADGGKQAEFTSAVKRSRRRASPAPVQRVRGRRAMASLGRRDVSTRLPWPTGASLRESTGVVCRDFQIFRGERWFNALGNRRWHDLPFFNDMESRR